MIHHPQFLNAVLPRLLTADANLTPLHQANRRRRRALRPFGYPTHQVGQRKGLPACGMPLLALFRYLQQTAMQTFSLNQVAEKMSLVVVFALTKLREQHRGASPEGKMEACFSVPKKNTLTVAVPSIRSTPVLADGAPAGDFAGPGEGSPAKGQLRPASREHIWRAPQLPAVHPSSSPVPGGPRQLHGS